VVLLAAKLVFDFTDCLGVVAIIAAFAAFRQVKAFKLFELLKYIESPDLRRSRRIVLREIDKRRDENWWDDSNLEVRERLEGAASDVCASYDILGKLIELDRLSRLSRRGYGSFYLRYWARSIVQTHEALKGFLVHRRRTYPEAYETYSRLASLARPYLGISIGDRLETN
jgi:hypothetical protein